MPQRTWRPSTVGIGRKALHSKGSVAESTLSRTASHFPPWPLLPDDIATLKAALAEAELRAETRRGGSGPGEGDGLECRGSDCPSDAGRSRSCGARLYGSRSEKQDASSRPDSRCSSRMLQAGASEDELAAEQWWHRKATTVQDLRRASVHRRSRFPEHLPRERVVIDAPTSCPCCGSGRLSKLGEDITETLEVIPRQWKVIQTVRERFSCRECERITQPPAPFHPTPRGFARPEPPGDDPVREVRPAPTAEPAVRALRPRRDRSQPVDAGRPGRRMHSRPFARLHRPDRERTCWRRTGFTATTRRCPSLQRARPTTGRVWVYVRDDQPFGGTVAAGGAVIMPRGIDRQQHPERHLAGLSLASFRLTPMRGYTPPVSRPTEVLGSADRGTVLGPRPTQVLRTCRHRQPAPGEAGTPTPISPLALEAVKRIDTLFDIEREVNGQAADERLGRTASSDSRACSSPSLEDWMRTERARLSRHALRSPRRWTTC